MEAKCPKCFGEYPNCQSCKGKGTVAVRIAEGTWYSLDCLDCKEHIGVCIVGEQGASIDYVQQHPENLICPFCQGQAAYSTEENPDNPLMYRLPLDHEEPDGKHLFLRITSQRLSRPRRCLSHRLKQIKRKVGRVFRMINS